ncbi:MAG: GHKL domain-containing protein [Ekhidna sp.]|nr:GHKL domain-containing protein [Ekhidna sp.]
MSLGKLSAGLAHELNNPSAAVVRSSKELAKHLKYVPDKFKAVIRIEMDEHKVDRVNAILFDSVSKGIQELSMMEKGDLEDEILDWLDERGVEDSDELAENFVDFGIGVEQLDAIAEDTDEEDQQAVFGWINQVLTTERLVNEIEDASQRISDLVLSIKSYTHMDQAPEKVATDIHDGINNTITMLNHKLKGSNVQIVKNYDENISQPEILPSSVNQVWTNLLDNAIDAMDGENEKKLTITTSQDGDFIKVIINDTGAGIPEEVMDKIFDPFFTTKPIGKGTGLGLENVQQIIRVNHNGTVDVASEPGNTTFKVCIPVKSKA